MRLTPAILTLPLALALSGCESSPTASHPDREFTDSQRSGCPANPFGPTDPIAPKRAAAAATYDGRLEIYTSRGKFIRATDFQFDPTTGASRSPYTNIVWDGRDAGGKEMPSGYYFMVLSEAPSGSTLNETKVQCIFWVNSADQGKMQ